MAENKNGTAAVQETSNCRTEARRDDLGTFAAWATVPPEMPIRLEGKNLFSSFPLIVSVVAFAQRLDDSGSSKPANSAVRRARLRLLQRTASQRTRPKTGRRRRAASSPFIVSPASVLPLYRRATEYSVSPCRTRHTYGGEHDRDYPLDFTFFASESSP